MVSNKILHNLIHHREYWKKVLPFLKSEYFDDPAERLIFEAVNEFTEKYGAPPNVEALAIEVDRMAGSNETLFNDSAKLCDAFNADPTQDAYEWLLDKTEEFCKDQAMNNALRKAVTIMSGSDPKEKLTKGAIPQLLTDALAISFDTNIGHDYMTDWAQRYDFYTRIENKIPFDLEYLNKITEGGLTGKTLTCFMAPSGKGKSIVLCHLAAAHLSMGKNVLYVSCEMSEERLAERIDMNLLDYSSKDLRGLSREAFERRFRDRTSKVTGRLKFKEYPGSTIGVAHIRHLLNELKQKQNFVPDVIYVDYLNIMVSTRVKLGNNVNSYALIKAIAEELRGLAVECEIPIVTATQVNRGGYDNSDIGMEDTSESMGLVHTLDLFIALISTEELAAQNQLIFKQLKNRYRDENLDRKFVVGIDKFRMRLFDVESSAQSGINATATEPVRKEVKVQPVNREKPKNVADKFGGWK